jgi:hypothetical protein
VAGKKWRECGGGKKWRECVGGKNNDREEKAGTLGIRDVFREGSALSMQIIGKQRAGRLTKKRCQPVGLQLDDRLARNRFLLTTDSQSAAPSADGLFCFLLAWVTFLKII